MNQMFKNNRKVKYLITTSMIPVDNLKGFDAAVFYHFPMFKFYNVLKISKLNTLQIDNN